MVGFPLFAVLAGCCAVSLVVVVASPMNGRRVSLHNFLPTRSEELAYVGQESEEPLEGVPLYHLSGGGMDQQLAISMFHQYNQPQYDDLIAYDLPHQHDYRAMHQQQQGVPNYSQQYLQQQQQQQQQQYNYLPNEWPGVFDAAGDFIPETHPVNAADPQSAQVDPHSQHSASVLHTAKRKLALTTALAKYRSLIGSDSTQVSLTCRRFSRGRAAHPEIVDDLNSDSFERWERALKILTPKRRRGVWRMHMGGGEGGDQDGEGEGEDDEGMGRATAGATSNDGINLALAFQYDQSDDEEEEGDEQAALASAAAASSSRQAPQAPPKGRRKKKRTDTKSQWYLENSDNTNRSIVLQHICSMLRIPEGRPGLNARERWRKRIQRNSTDENISGLFSDNTWIIYQALSSLKSKAYELEPQFYQG